jgi:hypothetical protein
MDAMTATISIIQSPGLGRLFGIPNRNYDIVGLAEPH